MGRLGRELIEAMLEAYEQEYTNTCIESGNSRFAKEWFDKEPVVVRARAYLASTATDTEEKK